MTELNDHLKLLVARAARLFCGREVVCDHTDPVVVDLMIERWGLTFFRRESRFDHTGCRHRLIAGLTPRRLPLDETGRTLSVRF